MDKSTLLEYQPNYYVTSKIMDNLNNANAIELNRIDTLLDNVSNQFWVDTADYTLERWEKELGLEVANNYDTACRRTRILSRLRGRGTITISLIENVAESFNNGTVEVIEDNSNYTFTIKFVDNKGVPPNLDDLKSVIEELKPAHLAVLYEFTYLTWDEFERYDKTCDEWDALNLTWDELEVYKEVI